MSAETGDPMLFATVRLPDTLAPFDFYRRYPNRDLPITTAVRLSAAFPYVSPAARADADDWIGRYTHVVDGGYFDNYGVSTLAAVVDAGLRAATPVPAPRRRVLVIEICDSEACSGEETLPVPAAGGPRRDWPYQLVAPLSAVVAMRSAAQRVTNRTTLRLLKDRWNDDTTCVASIQVPFGGSDAPLSWHLTEAEKRVIDARWKTIEAQTVGAVAAFLGSATAPPICGGGPPR